MATNTHTLTTLAGTLLQIRSTIVIGTDQYLKDDKFGKSERLHTDGGRVAGRDRTLAPSVDAPSGVADLACTAI
ncbi:hypothetical protein AB664_23655 [Brucella anthropi]|uniref:Uncharacterized protein n=1 Tax=Brucella anthropi TaxID=529 RepID=A0A656Z6D8_BRUAN|nr:hypothetical protein AB664_23655 [Brucella anthropi]